MFRNFLRSFILTSAVLVVAGVGPVAQAQERLGARDIARQIEEYCQADTAIERREEIVANLVHTGHSRTRNALRTALRNDESRHAVIRLIGELRHERCWELVGGYVGEGVDAATRQAALDTIFRVRDEQSLAELVKRWSETDPAGTLLGEIAAGLRLQGLSAAQVEEVLRHVGDAARGPSAREILAPHLMLAASESPQAFAERWSAIGARYRTEARRFAVQGHDILRDGTFHGARTVSERLLEENRTVEQAPWLPTPDFVIRRDANYLMELRQRYEYAGLARFNEAAFTLTLRFLPVGEVGGFVIGMQSEERMYECEVIEGEARMGIRELRGSITAPVRANEWNELVYTISFAGNRRVLQARLNGAPFEWQGRAVAGRMAQATFRGDLYLVTFRAPQEGQVVIGGFDLTVTDPAAGANAEPLGADERDPNLPENWRDRIPERWRDPQGPRGPRGPGGPWGPRGPRGPGGRGPGGGGGW